MSVAIRVYPWRRDELRAMKRGDDTYDSVIERLMLRSSIVDLHPEVNAIVTKLEKELNKK